MDWAKRQALAHHAAEEKGFNHLSASLSLRISWQACAHTCPQACRCRSACDRCRPHQPWLHPGQQAHLLKAAQGLLQHYPIPCTVFSLVSGHHISFKIKFCSQKITHVSGSLCFSVRLFPSPTSLVGPPF